MTLEDTLNIVWLGSVEKHAQSKHCYSARDPE